jgi:hypothetical protein
MQLEALIVRSWMQESSEIGDTLGGRDGARREMHLQAVIEPIRMSTLEAVDGQRTGC